MITLDITHDDDGTIAEVRRGGKLIALGVAMHEGRGQADTARRAIRNARQDMRLARRATPATDVKAG